MYDKNENKKENDSFDQHTRLEGLNFLFCWNPRRTKQHPLFCLEKYIFTEMKQHTTGEKINPVRAT